MAYLLQTHDGDTITTLGPVLHVFAPPWWRLDRWLWWWWRTWRWTQRGRGFAGWLLLSGGTRKTALGRVVEQARVRAYDASWRTRRRRR